MGLVDGVGVMDGVSLVGPVLVRVVLHWHPPGKPIPQIMKELVRLGIVQSNIRDLSLFTHHNVVPYTLKR